ncbi:MAG: hypothetical protein MI717_06715 [Spirochaetales bacterium]|nr:hypothetical protein [Spirochaetales bacterium]
MILSTLSAQNATEEAAKALEEWRWGVVALNDGLPGKSLAALERALTFAPTDPRIREWLGRAYWRSGMEDAALDVWEDLLAEDLPSVALESRAESLRRRLNGEEEIPIDDEWIPLTIFRGNEDGEFFFERPAVVRPVGDGSGGVFVSSYSGGDIVQLDPNGALVDRFEGGVEGFHRPFDILPIDENRLLVSEFNADRISVVSLTGYNRGYRMGSWGEQGRGKGQFLGPQYMALSNDQGYVYISDWGNRRVSKWNLEGEHVLDLGSDSRFSGFAGPAGIACYNNRVYVADSLKGSIEAFDDSGNYLGSLVSDGLNQPEGLAVVDDSLLIADGSAVRRVHLISGAMTVEATLGSGSHRMTSVFPDENGNWAASDFDANSIVLLTPLSTLYGGLEVVIDRVRADDFPRVAVDVSVKDRRGMPISGLDASNFRVFDGDFALGTPELDWRSSHDSRVSVAAVVDRSGAQGNLDDALQGLEDLISAMDENDQLSLIRTGESPTVRDMAVDSDAASLRAAVGEPLGIGPHSWDESLRLAATRLVPARNRKAVVAFVTRQPSSDAFDRYGLVETARLMANNGIEFYPVYASQEVQSRELDYIASQTNGKSSFVYDPQGSGALVSDLRRRSVGRYTLVWNSPRSSGYGREFLSSAVEVIYITKSGRDESGSFAPLQ